MQIRAAVSGTLGNTLEYFDFAIYGALAATLFPRLFFSQLGETAGLLASFATFGVGFVARPVGALVLGHLGDRFGRKPILFATLLLMGGSSILIGLLPTGQGIAIAVVLVLLRCLQGFSLGGEYTGSQLMTMEHCDPRRRGLFGSIIVAGSPISQVAANLVLVLLSVSLSTEQFESWGWRIPFIGSVLIVAVAFFVRRKLDETPAFAATTIDQDIVTAAPQGRGLRVLKSHPRQVAHLTLIWSGPALSFYLVAVYGLSYMTTRLGISSQTAFVILMVGNGVSVVTAILGGHFSDVLGRRPVFIVGLAGTFAGIGLFFTVAGAGVLLAGAIVTLTLASIQFLSGTVPALFAEQFPTDVRYSGSAVAYTFATLLFAAPSPFYAEGLTALGGPLLVAAFALVVLACSAVGAARLRDGRHLDLTEFRDSPAPAREPLG
jgi:MFS family permease